MHIFHERQSIEILHGKTLLSWMQALSTGQASWISNSLTFGYSMQTKCLAMHGQVIDKQFILYPKVFNLFLLMSTLQASLKLWLYARCTIVIAFFGNFRTIMLKKYIDIFWNHHFQKQYICIWPANAITNLPTYHR